MNIAHQVQESIPDSVKPLVDLAAFVTSVSAVVGLLTTVFGLVAAIASAAWALIRLYETKTVQRWLEKRRPRQ